MSFDLFSAKAAEELNVLVKSTLDKQLVLFVNYQPNTLPALESSGRFFQGTLNLYKMFKDTTRIPDKLYYLLLDICYEKDKNAIRKSPLGVPLDELHDNLSVIDKLRTWLAHNVNPENGPEDQRELQDCQEWMQGVLSGRKEPQNAADYDELVDALEQLGQTCCDLLKTIMQMIPSEIPQQKESLCKAWKQEILDRYTKQQGKNDIFRSQLHGLYCAYGLHGNYRAPNSYYRASAEDLDDCITAFLYKDAFNFYCGIKSLKASSISIDDTSFQEKLRGKIQQANNDLRSFLSLCEDSSVSQKSLAYQCFRKKYCNDAELNVYLDCHPKCTVEPQSLIQSYLDELLDETFRKGPDDIRSFIREWRHEFVFAAVPA